MQWQHGSYVVTPEGALILHPIAVDGRQLLSEPCRHSVGTYTRYNNTEHFQVCLVQKWYISITHHDRHILSLSTGTTAFSAST